MHSDIFHKMVKGNVIADIAVIIRIIYLQLFGYTRTDKGKPVSDPKLLSSVGSSAHKRALHGKELRYKLRYIAFDISHHRRAWLGDPSRETVILYIVYISPGGYIGAEGHIDHAAHAHGLKTSQYFGILLGIIRLKGGSDKKRDGLAPFQILKELFSIIPESSRLVLTHIETGSAGNTKTAVYLDT